jgi:hypothetical protein
MHDKLKKDLEIFYDSQHNKFVKKDELIRNIKQNFLRK